MKILFSHKLIGIVVSSWQASNIFWHSVTCLNAICVLISSLQQLCPLEKRGVRWFSFFHFMALFHSFVRGSLSSSLQHTVSFPVLLPSMSFALSFVICFTCMTGCPMRIPCGCQRQYQLFSCPCLSFCVMAKKKKSAVRQIGQLPVHLYGSVPVLWDSGVLNASRLSF